MRRRHLSHQVVLVPVFLLAVSLGPVARLAAQVSYTISDVVRLPAESFVGDPVELRYSIRTAYQTPEPVVEQEPLWGTIESMRLTARSDGFEVRIAVIPYEAGTLTLPEIVLGEIRLAGLSFVVLSVLGGDESLRPIHGPQHLPGTRSVGVVLLLALFLLPGIAIYLVGPGRTHIRKLYALYRSRAPHRQLIGRLDRLALSIEELSGKQFYTDLVVGLQEFMGARLGSNCTSQTSTELIDKLPDLAHSSGAPLHAASPLVDVLTVADSVKFASKRIRRTVRAEHLATVRCIAETLEAARRKSRRRSRPRVRWSNRKGPVKDSVEASRVGV